MAVAAPSLHSVSAVFTARVTSYKQWLVIGLVGLLFVFMPQLPNNDWQRNAADIPLGLSLYTDPAYVYPPWALLFFLPYYLLTAAGARVASVLVIGLLAQRRGWTVAQFLSVALAPLFLWSMALSSADVLLLLIPLLLWELEGRWQPLLRGFAVAVLLLKPQVSMLLLLYWLWTLRRQPRQILLILAVAVAVTLPVSMIGSPPLLAQWFQNLTHPVAANLDHWVYNNLSLSVRYGWAFGLAVVALTFGGLLFYLHMRRKRLPPDAPISLSLSATMLLAPYAANQGAIVPLALHPSWRVTLLQYALVFGAAILNVYALADDWILLSLVVLSVALAARSGQRKSATMKTDLV